MAKKINFCSDSLYYIGGYNSVIMLPYISSAVIYKWKKTFIYETNHRLFSFNMYCKIYNKKKLCVYGEC